MPPGSSWPGPPLDSCCAGSTEGRPLAVLAVEQVANRAPACRVQLGVGFVTLRVSVTLVRFTAGRAAIGKAGFIGFQFEVFSANGANFDRKRHNVSMINPGLLACIWSCSPGISKMCECAIRLRTPRTRSHRE